MNRKTGFTLIELLVVISIISLLASIVIASLGTAKIRAKEAAMEFEAIQLFKVIANYMSDKDDYSLLYYVWNGPFGEDDCDRAASLLEFPEEQELVNICHALFKTNGYQPINEENADRPFLIGIYQEHDGSGGGGVPYIEPYLGGYGITMLTLSGKMVCIGTVGGYYKGLYDLRVPNTSCYFSLPVLP